MRTKRVTVNECLEFLSSNTQVPSALGGQLERLKSEQVSRANWREIKKQLYKSGAREEEDDPPVMHLKAGQTPAAEPDEQAMLNLGNLARCLDSLGKQANTKFAALDVLPQYARKLRIRPGMLTLCIVRAYQPWHCDVDAKRPAGEPGIGVQRGPDRGLYEVYRFLQTMDRSLPPYEENPRKGRDKAAALLADADICIVAWVTLWNENAGFVDYMGTKEFALKHGLEERTVRAWCEQGKLPAVMVRERYRINVAELDEG